MIAITLARKPLSKGDSVARNALAHGTGGLDINSSRIRTEDTITIHTRGTSGMKDERRLYTGKHFVPIPEEWQTEGQKLGRWPSNLILMHQPGCVCSGVKETGSGERRKAQPGAQPFNTERGWNKHSMTREGASAPESYGAETMAAWICVENCPVADLESQTENVSRFFLQVLEKFGTS